MGGLTFEARRQPRFLEGFTLSQDVRQAEAARHKILRFVEAGPLAIKTVWDFDRTVTWGTMHNGHDATVLGFLTSRLPRRTKQRLFKQSEEYRPLERDNQLTLAQAEDWWITPYKAYSRRWHGLSMKKIEGFQEVAQPRVGVVTTFRRLEDMDIPRIIASGGNKDVISLWHDFHRIPPTEIISTEFTFNRRGRITGWKEDTLIHVLNKHARTNQTVAGYDRPLTILFGDSLEDADAIEGNGNVLRIRVKSSNPGETEAEKQAFRDKTFTKFDLLLEQGDFIPFLDLLDYIQGKGYAPYRVPTPMLTRV